MTKLLNNLREVTKSQFKYNRVWQPEFFRLTEPASLERFEELLNDPRVQVFDEIQDQLKELVKSQNPKITFDSEALQAAVEKHLNGTETEKYGVWVYYPWSQKLVHILDEAEYVFLRTNRNWFKISPEERDRLSTKKIGLIGLSVGQSVSLTMAMERSFGELRLADFDTLELTNLNRIRAGVHNLGLPKVIVVAREIMEIDPFLKLTLFPEGITEDNIDRFFSEGGKLDLLIDECDGIDIKVLCRFKARELQVPVVMEASDRGMVDVERFDLQPDRPILHGLIPDLDPQKMKLLKTNEEKIPYMLKIVGLDTVSARTKASMLEIGQTISTWPQLASAVTLGGGITADVVRRILLGLYHESGRYYVDVEELIGDKKQEAPLLSPSFPKVPEISESWKKTVAELPDAPAVAKEMIEDIAAAACHAPSGGNMQPWKWVYQRGNLVLFQIKELTSEFLDEHFIASYIALGASIEQAVLRAAKYGFGTDVTYFPEGENKELIAVLRFREKAAESEDARLGAKVFERHTNRHIEKSPAIPAEKLDSLKTTARKNGSDLVVLRGSDKDKVAGIIAMAEKLRLMNPLGHQNFLQEMRWTPEAAIASRDGVDLRTCDFTIVEETGLKLLRHQGVIDLLRNWNGGDAFLKLSRKSTDNADVLGIITRHSGSSKTDWLNAGRDLARVWIAANAAGLAFQPQSPITLILERLNTGNHLCDEEAAALKEAKETLAEILSRYNAGHPIFVFRLFLSTTNPVKSLRRDLNLHFSFLE